MREYGAYMNEQKLEKRKLKWRKKWNRHKEIWLILKEHGEDILRSPNFLDTRGHIQHGNMTVNDHCKNVAMYSVALADKLRVNCNKRDLVRGALLHDYFLYDWHNNDHEDAEKLHGFHHPTVALRNALRDYRLTARQRDIIRKHMWPLTPVPPTCKEAWLVTMADKYCSLMETIHLHKGHGKRLV